jgi:hypothetical protein
MTRYMVYDNPAKTKKSAGKKFTLRSLFSINPKKKRSKGAKRAAKKARRVAKKARKVSKKVRAWAKCMRVARGDIGMAKKLYRSGRSCSTMKRLPSRAARRDMATRAHYRRMQHPVMVAAVNPRRKRRNIKKGGVRRHRARGYSKNPGPMMVRFRTAGGRVVSFRKKSTRAGRSRAATKGGSLMASKTKKRRSGKRKLSAYNIHIKRTIAAGGTFRSAAATWKRAGKSAKKSANGVLRRSKSKVSVHKVHMNPGKKRRKGRRKGSKARRNPGKRRRTGRRKGHRASRNPLPLPGFMKRGVLGKLFASVETANLKEGGAVLAGAVVAIGAPALFGAWNSGWKGLALSLLTAGAASAVAAKFAPRYAQPIAVGGVVAVGLKLVQVYAPRALNWSGMSGFMPSRLRGLSGGLAGFLPSSGRVAGFLPTPARMSGVAASGGEVFRGSKY